MFKKTQKALFIETSSCKMLIIIEKEGDIWKSGETTVFFFSLLRSLCSVLVIYFLLACWSAGSAISSGLVVPML